MSLTVAAKYYGHDIECQNKVWVFKDTGLSVEKHHKSLSCGHCGKFRTTEEHDGCLGVLPGVMNACCGHGEIKDAYVQFLDGFCIRNESALLILEELKKGKEVK